MNEEAAPSPFEINETEVQPPIITSTNELTQIENPASTTEPPPVPNVVQLDSIPTTIKTPKTTEPSPNETPTTTETTPPTSPIQLEPTTTLPIPPSPPSIEPIPTTPTTTSPATTPKLATEILSETSIPEESPKSPTPLPESIPESVPEESATPTEPTLSLEQVVWQKVYLLMEQKQIKPITLFHQIDNDESGTITSKELRKGLFDLCDIKLTDPEFQTVLSTVDKDRSGSLDYKELSRAIKYGNPKRKISITNHKTKMKDWENKNIDHGKTPKKKLKMVQMKSKKKSPKSPKSPGSMSTTSTASNVFRKPTGISFLDRAAPEAQSSYQQALLIPSRVRRRSSRARVQMFKDFDLLTNTDSMSLQQSTHDLAARDSLKASGFRLSPTGRTIDPELLGADDQKSSEHIRAERTRKLANRKKDAEEEWSSWKVEKSKGIVEKKEKILLMKANIYVKKK